MNAHKHQPGAALFTIWREPVKASRENEWHSRPFETCDYCGSIHPRALAQALIANPSARLALADMKYGWPHKAYAYDLPNPLAGALESSVTETRPLENAMAEAERIKHGYAPAEVEETLTTRVVGGVEVSRHSSKILVYRRFKEAEEKVSSVKFYTEHLQDASPEDRDVIEHALGLRIEFDGKGGVKWEPY